MHSVTLTTTGRVELVRNLDDLSEALCELAGHLKTLAHSGTILSSDALFADEISKQFEDLSRDVKGWVNKNLYLQNVGER